MLGKGVIAASGSCVAATVLIGSSVAVTPLLQNYPVMAGQAWRYALGAAALFAVLTFRSGPAKLPTRRESVRLVILATIGLAAFNVLLLLATHHAEPAVIGAVVGAAPLVIAIGYPVMQRRTPEVGVLAAATSVTIGVFAVNGSGRASVLGLLLAVSVLLCEVGFTVVAAPLLPRLGPLRVSAYSCLAAAGLLAVAAWVTPGRDVVRPSGIEVMAVGWLGLAVTAAAFVAWYSGVQHLGAERAALFLGLVPLGTLGTGLVLHTTTASTRVIAGCLLVAVGVSVGVRTRPDSAHSEREQRQATTGEH